MKIFVTGISSFLGSSLLETADNSHEIFGSYYSNKTDNAIKLDISNFSQVDKSINKFNPDVIINLSSLRNNHVEENFDLGNKINVKSIKNLVDICNQNNTFLLYLSSDLVFDGKKGNYYEDDNFNPISNFGKTKIQAEKIISDNLKNFCIVRTSLLYGWDSKKENFSTMIINSLRKNKQIDIINDQFVTPSFVNNISKMLLEICEKNISGILHVAGKNSLSRFEFAHQIADIFDLNGDLINPISMKKLHWKTPRGSNCTLNTNKIQKFLKNKPITTKQGIELMKKEELKFETK